VVYVVALVMLSAYLTVINIVGKGKTTDDPSELGLLYTQRPHTKLKRTKRHVVRGWVRCVRVWFHGGSAPAPV